MKHSKYIDLTTDYGFKRIFGTEVNKDLLISFLNDLFMGRKEIKDIEYNKNEHVGDSQETGTVIFDLTCTGKNGEKFIIEVQRSQQSNLKRRMLYYGSKLISDQAPKGSRKEWNYAISEVYVIVLMDGFCLPDGDGSKDFLHDICLCKRGSGKAFYEDLGFIYIELINFTKSEEELVSDLDRWMHVLKDMSKMDRLPGYLRKPIFEKLFSIAEYSKLNKEERLMYDVSLKNKWDAFSIQETAKLELEKAKKQGLEEGREEGRTEGRTEGLEEGREEVRTKAEAEKFETALKLRKRGMDVTDIVAVVELTAEQIKNLKQSNN